MTIVGVLLDYHCTACSLDSTVEVVLDEGDYVIVVTACCDRQDEMAAAELNEHLADCGV